MTANPSSVMDDPQEEIAALVRTLHETQQRLQELAGGEVDAVLLPSGHSYLLHEAQEKLRQSEAAQRASRETLRLTLDAAKIGHWERDLITGATNRSAQHDRIFGYEELLPEWNYPRFLSHVIPEDRARVDRLFQAGVAAKTGWDFECRILRRDGALRWIWSHGNVFTNPAGEAVRMLGMVSDITERQRVEEALRESEELFSTAFRLSPDCVVISRVADRTVIRANEMLCRLWGSTPNEVIGKLGRDYLTWLTEEERLAFMRTLEKSGECLNHETTFRLADGRLVDFNLSSRMITFSGEACVLSVLRDVTERKRIEAAAAHLAAIVESSDDAIIGKDLSGTITSWNGGAERTFGYTAAEMVGQPLRRLIPPERQDEETEILSRVRRGESVRHFDTVRLRKDGSTIDVSVAVSAIRDAAGNLVGASKVARDVTERKRTEQALHESEEHFRFLNDLSEATRALADPAQIMAVMARMLGEHLRASRCAYADVERDGDRFTILHDYTDGCASTVGNYELSLFGPRAVATLYSGNTLIIRNVQAELSPGEGAEMFKAIGIQAIITCPLVKDGGLRAMMAVHQATPRDWQPGEITLVRDVVERCWATIERRTAEEKIHQLNAELERRVIERTTQLEAANKELEAFSYSISHDLRAPLRAVDGFSQAVLEDYGPQLPEAGQRYLQTIRGGAQRMGLLIDDLLTFSRLSRAPLQKQEVDTGRLVHGVLDDLSAEREGRQIDLRLGELPACAGDPALLKQVWINLLSNAFKYTQQRAVAVVEIGATRKDTTTVFFVRDNGTGFDMRYAGKLFGVFQRLHRQEEFAGTGVGLAIVQRIVHRHGGRIWAEAAPDLGATFHFTLEGETKP